MSGVAKRTAEYNHRLSERRAVMKWKLYSTAEVHTMAQHNRAKPVTDSSQRYCSSCGEYNIRFYYHELSKSGRIGSSYYWCPKCKKCSHSTGPRMSEEYDYTDPFDKLSREEFGNLENQNWYDRLDELWESGVLPQVFKLKA
jgi:hypothetical protein